MERVVTGTWSAVNFFRSFFECKNFNCRPLFRIQIHIIWIQQILEAKNFLYFKKKPSAIRIFLPTWNFLSFFPLYFGLLRLSWSGSTGPIEFGFDHWFRLAHALLIVFKFIAIVEVIRLFAFFLNYLRCIPLPTRDLIKKFSWNLYLRCLVKFLFWL